LERRALVGDRLAAADAIARFHEEHPHRLKRARDALARRIASGALRHSRLPHASGFRAKRFATRADIFHFKPRLHEAYLP